MAVVYLARDSTMNREVALKTIRFDSDGDPREIQFRRDSLTRDALAGKLNHPAIVTIYDIHNFGDSLCVSMEYVEGLTLQAALEMGAFSEKKTLLRILLQAAKALDYAHSKNVVHRDVKPGNIMIRTSGVGLEDRVKVMDFGIAREQARATLSSITGKQSMVVGTPQYMSPEQINGLPVDGRSDQFSLAILTHEALTHRSPFPGSETSAVVVKILTQDPELDPHLGPAVMEVFQKALSRSPADRYESCEAFVLELERALRPQTETQPPPVVAERPAPKQRTRSRLYVVAAAAVLFAALVVMLNSAWWVERYRRFSSPVTNPKDGLEYTWIPAGSFLMGCVTDDPDCDFDEKPRHQLALSRGFWLSNTETTVEAFEKYAAATGTGMPKAPDFNNNWREKIHPIVNVSWNEATSFCEWAGGRLPTEAEWEYSARGGQEGSRYPWGNSITHEFANYGEDKAGSAGFTQGRDRWEFTAPVASFAPNGWGLFDMAGNAMEWTNDWYEEDYYTHSPSVDPRGPASGKGRVLRGGSWFNGTRYMRTSFRIGGDPAVRTRFAGFRCALDEPPGHR